MTLAELADKSGIPARTIRFYIARGLMEGPDKAGRGADYTPAHLRRLEQVTALQHRGRTLGEIERILAGERRARPEAVAWLQHPIADDVAVWVRADASPWRMKQIRAAIDEVMSRLDKGEDE